MNLVTAGPMNTLVTGGQNNGNEALDLAEVYAPGI